VKRHICAIIKFGGAALAVETIAQNRKAYYDYHIVETIEAGIALTGSEIKSLRQGKVNLRDAYAKPSDGELWLVGAHIARYDAASYQNHDPHRDRKLLLHREEIAELSSKARIKGFSIVPLRLYLKRGRAKLELGLGRGKKVYDKRQAIAQRQAEREIEGTIKSERAKH
jgi:SsrA-binding protein